MKLFSGIVVILCLVTMFSCSKKDGQVRPKITVSEAEAMQSFAGYNSVKLTWEIPSGESITRCRVYWNNGNDSLTVTVPSNTNSDSVFISNLKEGSYTFLIALLDNNGNTSAKVSVQGNVYGKKYTDSLKNRAIWKVDYDGANAIVNIQWQSASPGAISTEILFKDSTGVSRDIFVPSYISTTSLKEINADKESIIRYRTLFIPELKAIDTFYTAFDTIKIYGEPPVVPKVLWDGNPAHGSGVWKHINIDGKGSVTVINDPTYGHVWKFYKPVGSHRTEGHGANGFQANEGDVFYIGWRYKLTMPVNTTTNAIFQWKAYGSNMKQNYPVVLKPVNGKLTLMYHNPDYQAEYIWTTPTVTNKWISIVLKLKISRDATKGYIEFWYNGKQQTLSNGSVKYPARTLDADYCDPKWGVYGADDASVTNEVTDLKIATTYQLAAPE